MSAQDGVTRNDIAAGEADLERAHAAVKALQVGEAVWVSGVVEAIGYESVEVEFDGGVGSLTSIGPGFVRRDRDSSPAEQVLPTAEPVSDGAAEVLDELLAELRAAKVVFGPRAGNAVKKATEFLKALQAAKDPSGSGQ